MYTSSKISKVFKNLGLILLTVLLVAGGSLFQQKVLQVNAAVQVLLVSRTAIGFGDVFPGQNPSQTYTVQLDTSANAATYVTTLAPLPGLQNLCPFLNLHSIDSPPEADTLTSSTLKRPGDTIDNWQVQLSVPGIQGQLSQDHTGGIIVTGGNFGCKITITTTADPGKIIICKQSVGGTGTFNYTGDLGNFSIQTSQSSGVGDNDDDDNQTNPCGTPCPIGGGDQTSGSNSSITDFTKCITTTTVTNTNTTVVTNTGSSVSSTGGNVITTGNGDIKNGAIVSGSSSSNTSVTNSVNNINSTVNTASGVGSQTFNNLQPGSYTVTESSSTAWALNSLVCNDPTNNSKVAGSSANIQLDDGETVVCTFVNTQKKGTIVIQKKAVNGNGNFSFSGNLGLFSIATISGLGSKTFSNLSSGVYTVTEPSDQLGWSLTSLTCIDPSGDTQTNNRNAVIHLSPGETVTCTFTNTKKK